jgi:hypothetical protein
MAELKEPQFKEHLPDIGHIRALERQTSVCTNQGAEGTCYAHSRAKLFLQNIYMFVHFIEVTDIERFQSCFAVLKTDIEHDYTTLTREKCGSGYIKILLFLYLYWYLLNKQYIPYEKLIPSIIEMPDIEQIPKKNRDDLHSFKERFDYVVDARGLIWNTFTLLCNVHSIPFLNELIMSILDLNLYIEMIIELPTTEPTEPLRHGVIIVKYRKHLDQIYFGISNSWGEIVDNTSDLTEIHLKGHLFKTKMFEFVLPFCTKENQYGFPTTPLPENNSGYNFKLTMDWIQEWFPNYCDEIRDLNSIPIPMGGGKKKRNTKKRRSRKRLNKRLFSFKH